MEFKRAAVNSSNVKSAGYDPQSQTFEIEFLTGIYRFKEVPQEVVDGFQAAESKGRYFAQNIKGKFVYEKTGEGDILPVAEVNKTKAMRLLQQLRSLSRR